MDITQKPKLRYIGRGETTVILQFDRAISNKLFLDVYDAAIAFSGQRPPVLECNCHDGAMYREDCPVHGLMGNATPQG